VVALLDEPTASLSDKEIGSPFAIIENLKAKGIDVGAKSEIHRILVMRNGSNEFRKAATCQG
jgi:ABC-type sugar transport system ATPase subunit